jgi:hypothetical protein
MPTNRPRSWPFQDSMIRPVAKPTKKYQNGRWLCDALKNVGIAGRIELKSPWLPRARRSEEARRVEVSVK